MSLEDSLNTEFAPAWRPEVGDMLIGEVSEISTREGSWGPYRVLTLRTDAGERFAVHAFHYVLVEELKKIRPQVGHRIGIKYLGRPAGKNYDAYRVATENPPVVDWGSDAEHDSRDRVDEPPYQPPHQPVPSGNAAPDDDDVPF